MQCPRCQYENPTSQKFCGECGTPRIGSSGPRAPEASYADVTEALSDALNRETATSEILRIIGTSPTDAQPIFDGIARSGVRLCGALGCAVFVVHGDMLYVAATHGIPPDRVARFRSQFPAPLVAGRGTDGRSDVDAPRAVLERRIFHLADIENNPESSQEQVEMARLGGYRTRLMVPMVRGDKALGLIAITSRAATPFTAQQVGLLETFADQAVIAIENVRLFKELEARNRDLTEALDQQTATSDILRVISSSPTDVQPVFDVIVEQACRLCDAVFANAVRIDGDLMHNMAAFGFTPEAQAVVRRSFPMRPSRATMSGRAILERAVVMSEDASIDEVGMTSQDISRSLGGRAMVSVPMLRDGIAVGAITLARRERGRFPERQVNLLRSFAHQAVIALENVRLFTELQEKNRELTSALDKQ